MFPPRLFFVYCIQIIIAFIAARIVIGRWKLPAIPAFWARVGLWTGILAHAFFYYLTYMAGHNNFNNGATDFATISQSIWNISQGNIPFETILGTHALRVHFSPIWYAVGFLFKLWPSVDWLVLISTIIVALCSYIIFKMAHEIFKQEWVALAFALSYLLNPYVQLAQVAALHAESIDTLFIFISLYGLLKQRWSTFFIAMAVALLGKEDVGLYYGGLSFFIIFGLKKVKLGIITGIVGFVWSLSVYTYIMPLFGPDTVDLATKYYGYLGSSFSDILRNVISQPWRVVMEVINQEKVYTLFYLFASTGFLAFFSGWALIPLMLSIGLKFLTNYPAMFYFRDHYSLHVMPFLYLSAILGLKQLLNIQWIWRKGVFGLNSRVTFFATFIVILAVLVNLENGDNPFSRKFKLGPYKITSHNSLGLQILKMIPENASVIAQENICPHLAFRKKIYAVTGWLHWKQGETPLYTAEYVVFDLQEAARLVYGAKIKETAAWFYASSAYEVVVEKDGWVLFRKK